MWRFLKRWFDVPLRRLQIYDIGYPWYAAVPAVSVASKVARPLLLPARKCLLRNWFVITPCVKRSYCASPISWNVFMKPSTTHGQNAQGFLRVMSPGYVRLCYVRVCTYMRMLIVHAVYVHTGTSVANCLSLSLSLRRVRTSNTRGPSSSPTKHVINRCHWSLMRERNKNVPWGSDYSRDSFHEEAGLLVFAPRKTQFGKRGFTRIIAHRVHYTWTRLLLYPHLGYTKLAWNLIPASRSLRACHSVQSIDLQEFIIATASYFNHS